MVLSHRLSLHSIIMKILVVTFFCFFSFACSSQAQPKKTIEKETVQANASWISVKVIFLEFEGGFYGLVTNEGEKLLPINLGPEYKVANTKLKIQGKKIEGMMTIQQWGTPFKIAQIELVSKGENKNKASHK